MPPWAWPEGPSKGPRVQWSTLQTALNPKGPWDIGGSEGWGQESRWDQSQEPYLKTESLILTCLTYKCHEKCLTSPGGFPHSSVGKESACNAGDPSLIPVSGRSTGEGIGYPLQYSWAPLVTQLVKNPPAMWETWVWSLGWEYPLEKGKATHSSILAWRTLWTV